MHIQARDYQLEAVSSIYRYFETNTGNPLVAMPTATGKSVVIAMFLQSVFQYPNQRVMMCTHVKELIAQNYEKLMAVWPQAPAGIYSAGLGKRDRFNSIIFAGIASVGKRAKEFGYVDLLIIDEAHLVSPSDETLYFKFITGLKATNPNLKVIGLTATPWRLGLGHITQEGGIFTDVCFDITGLEAFNRLIGEGYLSTLVPKKMQALLDTSGVHMRGGEFNASELQFAVDKSEVTYAALQEAMQYGQDRRSWLIFASGVEHAMHIAEMLTGMGVQCRAVHSKIADGERDEILRDFKSGKLRAVVNNNVLTTGFDHPGIDLIVMLRPTASAVLWVQMLGRGTRVVYAPGMPLDTPEQRLAAIEAGPKHNCLVLDFANNTRRLGPINDPVIPRKKGEGKGDAPVKECTVCNTWNHASARQCFNCGSEFPLAVKIVQTAGTDELIKNSLPVTETFAVTQITYTKHTKQDRPPSLKLSYYCGLRSFHEFVALELEGAGRNIAKRWWSQRKRISNLPELPEHVDDVMLIVNHIPAATHIRVWTNKKPYPQILDHCFDGTCFNTQPADMQPIRIGTIDRTETKPWLNPVAQEMKQAQLEARMNNKDIANARKLSFDDMDDDIPF